MADFIQQAEILITCPKNIAPFLEREVLNLGYKPISIGPAYVKIEGTLLDCMRLNLWLRTAHKVLYKIKEFEAQNPDRLYVAVKAVSWGGFIHTEGYFTVHSVVLNETIKDTRFANLKVKDAVADWFMEKRKTRPDAGSEKEGVVLFLHWQENNAALYIDTSGETVARHNYRKNPYTAPMQETLAAAVLMATKWDKKTTFINPMCGSGTLSIEAALLAANIAPGLNRANFCFMHLPGFPEDEWDKLKLEAKQSIRTPEGRFILTDHDAGAIEASRTNATKAGVEKYMEFAICDFKETEIPKQEKGIVILNPEYGERLGKVEELERVYQEIGDFFKKQCQGYVGYVFTGNLDLGKKIGLKTKRKIPFYSGKIECRLLEYELYAGTTKGK